MGVYLYLGIIGYVLVSYLYVLLLKTQKSLAVANILWNLGTVITVTAVSIFYFKQKLTNRQLLGIGVSIFGIILLNN